MDLSYMITTDNEGMSVKDFLLSSGISHTILKKAKFGGITVSGKTVTVRHILKKNEELRVFVPEISEERIPPISIPIPVVYEDEHILIVDKPTGMPTHPSKGNSLPTLANAVVALMGKEFVFRAVNRLDRDTSGLVLIAKNAFCASRLSLAMKRREIIKKYVALVEGKPANKKGMIDAPIRRESEGSIKRIVASDGKDALTEYEVIKQNEDCSLLEITLHTGRTHQIRVHMAYIGHPLVGDFLYGKRRDEGYELRCHFLSFVHPITGSTISIKI